MASVSIVPRHVVAGSGATPPSERVRLAFIGVGGRGGANLRALSRETVVALCDVDQQRAAKAFAAFPKAQKFRDFRRMLDRVEKQIDAVVVSTPDHTHAVAAMDAMRRGKHVYCEKPLAHSIAEVRALQRAAHRYKVVTQLGNQGHSFDSIRSFCEWIWDGAIGEVHTVHAVCGSNYSKIAQLPLLKEHPPVPPTLDWDLWLGPAPYRPYHPVFLPGAWRGWTPFGSGVIGDWVCHVVDPVFWALDLGAPTTVHAETTDYDPKKHALTFPPGSKVTYTFPAKGKRGPVKLIWYDGSQQPPRPPELDDYRRVPRIGAIVEGTQGKIMYGSHGAAGLRLIPDARMKAYTQPPKKLRRGLEHHADWLEAIRQGRPAGSNFDYGGPLTEIALLGIIAIRLSGRRLEWDSEHMRFTNSAEANALITPSFRQGWHL